MYLNMSEGLKAIAHLAKQQKQSLFLIARSNFRFPKLIVHEYSHSENSVAKRSSKMAVRIL